MTKYVPCFRCSEIRPFKQIFTLKRSSLRPIWFDSWNLPRLWLVATSPILWVPGSRMIWHILQRVSTPKPQPRIRLFWSLLAGSDLIECGDPGPKNFKGPKILWRNLVHLLSQTKKRGICGHPENLGSETLSWYQNNKNTPTSKTKHVPQNKLLIDLESILPLHQMRIPSGEPTSWDGTRSANECLRVGDLKW